MACRCCSVNSIMASPFGHATKAWARGLFIVVGALAAVAGKPLRRRAWIPVAGNQCPPGKDLRRASDLSLSPSGPGATPRLRGALDIVNKVIYKGSYCNVGKNRKLESS